MRVLVTGAFGYVGRAVTRALLDTGHEVVAMTTQPNRTQPSGRVQIVVADLRSSNQLMAAVDRVDAVAHLAALTRVRESFAQPGEYAMINTVGTEHLLAAVASTGRVMPFIHASTAAVYGTPEKQPIGEDCEPAPTSPYGETKLAADMAVRDAAVKGSIGGVSLRAFNIAGAVGRHPDPDLTRILPKVVAVAGGRFDEVTVNGDGSAIRDYVHIADLANAFCLAIGAAQPGKFDIFNIGATPATVAQIIEITRKITGHEIPAKHNPPAPEAPELRADTTRALTTLRWIPTRSDLEQIIGDAWDAEKSNS
ncbi:NAD-dependent epimerase/dehydratase [Catenulispora acidiphila DSM 44928]|uniref:UDP-glucose 4-epimerase n=1 Tax=Catenulispora acidiphila (strain DSM 44928 / JCM 14897 / NBRC 102108 / NRRL B-24433 / ID139908) TaxID=479433 RepID=C7QEX1_CATAD|nr:NAD-dependent epimerase/dehydratase family protein [Catenulispora acidiphila]ACU72891.1 NAD-dependent epimerase/dehydratase [Catenulispora acidiphila DSM 44928]